MDYVADSDVATVTVVAVTSAAQKAAPGLDKEGSDKYDIKDSWKHTPFFLPKECKKKPFQFEIQFIIYF